MEERTNPVGLKNIGRRITRRLILDETLSRAPLLCRLEILTTELFPHSSALPPIVSRSWSLLTLRSRILSTSPPPQISTNTVHDQRTEERIEAEKRKKSNHNVPSPHRQRLFSPPKRLRRPPGPNFPPLHHNATHPPPLHAKIGLYWQCHNRRSGSPRAYSASTCSRSILRRRTLPLLFLLFLIIIIIIVVTIQSRPTNYTRKRRLAPALDRYEILPKRARTAQNAMCQQTQAAGLDGSRVAGGISQGG